MKWFLKERFSFNCAFMRKVGIKNHNKKQSNTFLMFFEMYRLDGWKCLRHFSIKTANWYSLSFPTSIDTIAILGGGVWKRVIIVKHYMFSTSVSLSHFLIFILYFQVRNNIKIYIITPRKLKKSASQKWKYWYCPMQDHTTYKDLLTMHYYVNQICPCSPTHCAKEYRDLRLPA